MKRLAFTLICVGLGACASLAPVEPAAPVAAATASPAIATAAPASQCPLKTELLFSPPLPEAGVLPAAPSGATVVKPRRLQSTKPDYPSASMRCREQGKVTITYCVSAEGRVENVQVTTSSGYARLDNSMLAWAARERHTPATVNGKPSLYCGLIIEQTFVLDSDTGASSTAAR